MALERLMISWQQRSYLPCQGGAVVSRPTSNPRGLCLLFLCHWPIVLAAGPLPSPVLALRDPGEIQLGLEGFPGASMLHGAGFQTAEKGSRITKRLNLGWGGDSIPPIWVCPMPHWLAEHCKPESGPRLKSRRRCAGWVCSCPGDVNG